MVNNVIIQGRLVRDPELRQTPSGVSVANFSIACERDYKNGDERVSDFVDCVAWRGTADFIQRNFNKGRMIIVVGKLQSRKWVDNDGHNRTNWEVQVESVYFSDSKKGETEQKGADLNGLFGDDPDLPF